MVACFLFFFLSVGILKEVADSAQSSAKTQSARNDVDQDVFLMFNVVDENLSWYLEKNKQSCLNPELVDLDDPDFQESNLMHGEKKKKERFFFGLNGPPYISEIF